MRVLILLVIPFLFYSKKLQAQLCAGSLGDPVANITFGSGSNPGPAQPNTNYSFVTTDCPNDGQYAVRNSTSNCFFNNWHSLSSDHTGNPNGYFMLVNASYSPGDFYVETVRGLCGNTTYEFATWVMNVQKPAACNANSIRPNLTFSIETTRGAKIVSFNSGDIETTHQPVWKQYGTFFTTPANVSDVVIRITNNAPGGCGNDIALDDITFRPCGATISATIEGADTNVVQVCAGQAASRKFLANASTGYNNPKWQWQESRDGGQTWNNIAGATATSYQWNETIAGTFLYRVLVAEKGSINAPSCRVASKPLRVVVNKMPDILSHEQVVACEGQPVTLEAGISFGDTSGYSFEWLGRSTAAFTPAQALLNDKMWLQLKKPAASLSDTGQYSFNFTSAAGCSVSRNFSLHAFPKPIVDFQVMGAACVGSPTSLRSNDLVQGGSSLIEKYFWQWGDARASNEKDIAPVFEKAGVYPVNLTVASANGCPSDKVKKDVQVHARPVARFAMPGVCITDGSARFTNHSSVEGGAVSFRWHFSDPLNAGFESNQKDPVYRFQGAGHYRVKLEVTSAVGCNADTAQVFTVNGAHPNAQFSLDNVSLRCSADSIVLRNSSSVDFGNITRLEIFWKGDNDETAKTVDDDPSPGKEYKFRYDPFITGAAGTFSIRVVAYSGQSCRDEQVREITVYKSPDVEFAALNSVCLDHLPFPLTGGRGQVGLPGNGVYTGPGVDPQGMFRPAVAGVGSQAILFRFTTPSGCSDTASRQLLVWPQPQVNAGPDKTIVAGGAVSLLASAQGEELHYQWTPATALSDANVLQPVVKPVEEMTYRFTATSANGCAATDEVHVFVVPDLFIPNAFTPNGDGVNDTWQVPYLESIEDAEVFVFNRYGQQVFAATKGNQKWDGRFNGKVQPSGAYVYMVKLKGRKVLRGTLMLLR